MKNQLFKFIEMKGKRVSLLLADGTYWVAVKPLCEALNVDYVNQFKNLKDDDFYAGALSNQTMHDTSGRRQEMLCISEKYVYGWLASIKSDSMELKKYKKECYDILYNHFKKNGLVERAEILERQQANLNEIEELKLKMKNNPDFVRLSELNEKKKSHKENLAQWDMDLLMKQTSLDLN